MTPTILAGEAQAILVLIGKQLERSGDEFFKELGLSASQFEVLRILWQKDNLTLGELSQIMCCAPANITGLVDRLEKKGLLYRTDDLKDRRISRVVLTEAGQKLHEPIIRVVDKYLAIFNVLQHDELTTLVNLLKKLYRQFEVKGACLPFDVKVSE